MRVASIRRQPKASAFSLFKQSPILIVPAVFVILFILAIVTPSSASQSVLPSPSSRSLLETSSEEASTVLKNFHSQKRYTFFTSNPPRHLEQYPSEFCGGKSVHDCDFPQYAESIFLTSALAFIVGIVALIAGVVFWVFRSCCCGGCKASEGMCLPGERFSVEMGDGYTKKQVLLIKAGVVLCFIAMVPFFAVGFVGNKNTTLSVQEFGDTILNTVETVRTELQYIDTTLMSLDLDKLPDQAEISAALASAVAAANETYSKGKQIESLAHTYNGYRESAVLAGLILPLALMAITTVGALAGLGPLSLVAGVLGFVALFVGWVTFGIHYPLPLILSDLCDLFGGGVATIASAAGEISSNSTDTTGSTESTNPLVAAISQCGNGTSNPFSELEDIAEQGVAYAYNQTCTAFADACAETYKCYPNGFLAPAEECHIMQCEVPANASCNEATIQQYLISNITNFELGCVDYVAEDVDCSIIEGDGQVCASGKYAPCNVTWIPFLDCPTDCIQADFRNITTEIVADYNLLVAYVDVLYDHIFPLLNCDLITSLIDNVQSILCVTLVDSIYYITIAEGGLSAILIFGVVLSIMGIKRFNSKNRALSEEDLAAQKY